MAKYDHVNSQWPETLPEVSDQEAISGAKRLYRFAMKKAFKGKVLIATGNRYTWIRSHVLYVNPRRTDVGHLNRGWPDIVHFMSHLCHQRLHPTWKPHGPEHHAMEREMVSYVIRSGWLEGKLKTKPKAIVNTVDKRHTNVLLGIKRWTTKLKRAQTALAKLQRQKRYYERKAASCTT